jgi:hypothetical protein
MGYEGLNSEARRAEDLHRLHRMSAPTCQRHKDRWFNLSRDPLSLIPDELKLFGA